jgi:transglutaminase-like putative cysteine protease
LLDPENRRALLARSEHRVFQPGEVLIHQGSAPRSLFRVHSGFARVHREHCGAQVELSRMQPGTWFGELSLIDGSPASATVTAESRIEVDQISDEGLRAFIAEAPTAAVAFYKALSLILSRRLRHLTEVIPERLFDEAPSDVSLLKPDGLVSYLTQTEFCNFEHPAIQTLAATLAADAADDSEVARRVFYYVRDEIKYTLGLNANRASDTLAQRHGSCSHKANLFVALMRSLDIPSGYHFMFVKTREYLGPTNTVRFSKFMSHRSLHVLPAALIEDRWVRCDATDDARLSDGWSHINPHARRVDFDGHHDAMLSLPLESVDYYDATCWPSVDAILSRAQRISPVVVGVFNRYLDFGREFGRQFKAASAISDGFFEWLRDVHPEEHRAYEKQEAALVATIEATPNT